MLSDLRVKIEHNSSRLAELTGDDNKRARKRVLQTLGKLKRQLTEMEGTGIGNKSDGVGRNGEGKEEEDDGEGGTEEKLDKEGEEGGVSSSLSLSKKKHKALLKSVNDECSSLAKNKQLSLVYKTLRRAIRKGLVPDVHSLTILINAHARVGDVSGCIGVYEWMNMGRKLSEITVSVLGNPSQSLSSLGLGPHFIPATANITTHTSVMKGLCETGLLAAAAEVLIRAMGDNSDEITHESDVAAGQPVRKKHKKDSVSLIVFDKLSPPKSKEADRLRCLNTFLRGCVRIGAVRAGYSAFTKYIAPNPESKDSIQINPDISTIEYICLLLGMNGRIDLCESALTTLMSSSEIITDERMISVYTIIVRACVLVGDIDKSKQWSALLQHCLENPQTKVGPASSANNSSMSHSQQLFAKHRQNETTLQGRAWLFKLDMTQTTSSSSSSSCGINYRDLLSRICVFGLDGEGDILPDLIASRIINNPIIKAQEGTGVVNFLSESLEHKFGVYKKKQNNTLDSALFTKMRSVLGGPVVGKTPSFIDINALFAPFENFSLGSAITPLLDASVESIVCLELGCGNGEWVTRQAHHSIQEGKQTHWLANELRCDRAYATLATAAYSNINNLAVLAGDAKLILSHHIKPNSLTHIVSNHPEPPFRIVSMSEAQSQHKSATNADHLLTPPFLNLVHSRLCSGGMFTVTTDQKAFAVMLEEYLLKSKNWEDCSGLTYKSSSTKTTTQFGGGSRSSVSDNCVSTLVRRGLPPAHSGLVYSSNIVDSKLSNHLGDSYFDRMWSIGEKKKRFYIHVQKV